MIFNVLHIYVSICESSMKASEKNIINRMPGYTRMWKDTHSIREYSVQYSVILSRCDPKNTQIASL